MTQVNDQYLKHIDVNNPELLEILGEYAKLHTWAGFEKNCHLNGAEHIRQRSYYVGAPYMNEILDQKTAHEGFPDQLVGYNFKLSERAHSMFEGDADPIFKRDFTRHLGELNDRMMNFLSVKHNALCAVYPPGGYISWHNNANAPGFNLIFSYSGDGSGYFDYIHPETKEVVRCQDKPGVWTCKAAYFGHYREPETLLYHAAAADTDWRCTVSYVFDTTDGSDALRDLVLEDIASAE
mgnify:FL=1|jgi:hypothetical protein